MANFMLLVILVMISIRTVLVAGECHTNSGPINNCCCLGYNSNNYNVKSSGVYTIGNFCGVKCSNARVYCDTTSGGGGWTVIMRRQDGSVEFEKRDWVEHEDGFGDLTGEFWLGLRSMNCLTNNGNWELRIDFQLDNGTKSYLHYKQFAVGPPENQYQLTISGFVNEGLTDPFYSDGSHQRWSLNKMKFTSRDRDHDNRPGSNCAPGNGGWWYNSCSRIELNEDLKQVHMDLNGETHNPTHFEMKIRPLDCEIN